MLQSRIELLLKDVVRVNDKFVLVKEHQTVTLFYLTGVIKRIPQSDKIELRIMRGMLSANHDVSAVDIEIVFGVSQDIPCIVIATLISNKEFR